MRRSRSPDLKNQKGQMFVESILLMIVFTSITITAYRQIRTQNLLGNMVQGPWTYVQGMVENGVWEPAAASRGFHPNQLSRALSSLGTPVQGG